MNRSTAKKLIFLVLVVVIAIAARAVYPAFSSSTADAVRGLSASSTPAQPATLVLPFLSADGNNGTGSGTPLQGAPGQNASETVDAQAMASVFTKVSDGAPPEVDDSAGLVADLTTGARLFSDNADSRWPLASVSKLMTATLAVDLLDPNERITITPAMVAVDPTELILRAGDTYTVSDLLRILLLPSNNVAATALADAYGYSQFVAAMNARAQSWGMANTHYDDPSGLSAGNQSTADDLLSLAQKVYTNYPQILAITRTPQVILTNLATGKQVTVKSINAFAGEPDFIGGKTGYTDQADGNLLSIFSYDGHPILIVVLGTDEGVRFNDTEMLYDWFKANYR